MTRLRWMCYATISYDDVICVMKSEMEMPTRDQRGEYVNVMSERDVKMVDRKICTTGSRPWFLSVFDLWPWQKNVWDQIEMKSSSLCNKTARKIGALNANANANANQFQNPNEISWNWSNGRQGLNKTIYDKMQRRSREGGLNTSRPPSPNNRLLRVRNHQFETRVPLLTLP